MSGRDLHHPTMPWAEDDMAVLVRSADEQRLPMVAGGVVRVLSRSDHVREGRDAGRRCGWKRVPDDPHLGGEEQERE